MKYRKALITALIFIAIAAAGNVVLDGIQYHQASLLRKIYALSSQIPHSSGEETNPPIDDARTDLQLRIEVDCSMFLLSIFSLWFLKKMEKIPQPKSEC
jgi:hypothetical protein